MNQQLAEAIKTFEEECKKRDPGMRVEINPVNPLEFILSTINSAGTVVNYSFAVSSEGVNIARIL